MIPHCVPPSALGCIQHPTTAISGAHTQDNDMFSKMLETRNESCCRSFGAPMCQHIVDSTRNSVFNNAERMWPCLDYVQGDSWVGRVHDEGETIEREVISMTSTQQPSPPRHARLYEEAGSG
ncbi:hypothetical protein HBH69_220150 [Parastagonospora nodorum]|nr:hypothetical protein HBH69_220150 [Parastagonospora nodorum]